VLIADDHPLILQGLARVMKYYQEITVVGEAKDGEDVVNKAGDLQPDVIIMDLNMPKMDGLEATKIIRKQFPKIQVIALTVEDSEQRVIEVVKSGVRGYILKDVEPDALVSSIKAVHEGETVIHPKITSKLFRELERVTENPGANTHDDSEERRLTPREIEVLEYIVMGAHNRDIASSLFISEKTVKNHISSIFRKLKVEDRTQVALSAIKAKIVKL